MTLRLDARLLLVLLGAGLASVGSELRADDRPNILWIIADDLSPELSCYGYKGVKTPNIDALASQGARYTNAFSTAPVCSTSRSAFITGVYQTATGTHHHRMKAKQPLPRPVQPITELLRQAGYFVCNGDSALKKAGKTDYNFTNDGKMYDGADWAIGGATGRKPGQPFFAQVQIKEPHRSFVKAKDPNRAAGVRIPAYYPEHPVIRADWANYLETIEVLDQHVGNVLKRLEKEGLADNTLLCFFGDHGRPHYRDKQWLYDGGLRVPLLVRWPNEISGGTVCEDLVGLIDVSAATIAAAGLSVPEWMDGRDMLAADFAVRNAVFAARDRAGSTLDRVRCIRTSQYKYIRNFHPDRPYSQHSGYKVLQYPGQTVAQVLHERGELSGPASSFWAATRPAEELYDVAADPEELINLVGTAQHADVLMTLQKKLDAWIERTDDQGRVADPNERAETKASELWYLGRMKKRGFAADYEPEQYLKWWENELGLDVLD